MHLCQAIIQQTPASQMFPKSASILSPSAFVCSFISYRLDPCNSFRAAHSILSLVSPQTILHIAIREFYLKCRYV